ncbi:MAG: SDR family NAD(P)-dependent oxidoreductase [Phenylobacterium sp.]|jgi:NAD(P)-dependent dehydrogenase (short-subunit alcohol dehydrogenase family)|uniref:SDR family NAD(P)-dependent oxidoreductase n=1 Tax=Phenylobacterium sp. TaxID=1871053 RepID=UPI0027285097|nr:SDR family NAD(P)-dependent oxidoreductase [Phenylobacterium sp.]MDO8321644.1 SDR family NAD(P)-dependent oxidoreductase [Phenylobacterium sp.]MDO8910482.1 SDR family NAD(P)-dependent oxidoreductase [Phenylobacterium sp.]MDP2009270.1 SDR family NAD(P)-dependent oxidoreductase [Phenylobacterium sp.]MDP3101311.1 SDR family NAD(P)-dependent oxidoreductase [Phenylobacterium sp.]HQT54717.1 SDR family NAD(P)-dependent oxidoreductase [Phenylobacterium sp.]
MGDRLKGKTAIIVGAGQTPGETIGNGRAMSILFAREGAQVLCVDRVAERAEETAAMIVAEGGQATAFTANVTKADDVAAMIEAGKERLGRIDILVNNVGIGGGDGPAHRVEEAAFDRILSVNLKGMWLTIKAAIPTMREQGGGAIVNISSLAGIAGGNQVAYEVSKAAVNRLTTSVAQSNAAKGVRCNAIMPGLMDTPMAVAGIAQASGQEQEAVRAARNARVPLGGKMGNAWDTAYAALFLASDEAGFITGAILPVDGGMGSRIG